MKTKLYFEKKRRYKEGNFNKIYKARDDILIYWRIEARKVWSIFAGGAIGISLGPRLLQIYPLSHDELRIMQEEWQSRTNWQDDYKYTASKLGILGELARKLTQKLFDTF